MCTESELEISLKSYPRRGENVISVQKTSRQPLGDGFGNHDGASEVSIGDSDLPGGRFAGRGVGDLAVWLQFLCSGGSSRDGVDFVEVAIVW